MDSEQAGKAAQFSGITGQSPELALQYLQENEWDLDSAVAHFYETAENEDDDDEADEDSAASSSAQNVAGGRRLGVASGTSQPTTHSSGPSTSRSSKPGQSRNKIQSLSDLQNAQSQDDDDEEKDQEYFAGGDKSGLAVTDPGSGHNQHVQRLLDTARRNGPPPPRDQDAPTSFFRGQGQTLGGDDAPSRIIPDPQANNTRAPPMVERTLHLWDDGFSIDDGDLYRYDDPANRRTLEMINRGSAPLDLMNVEPGQAVDVKLDAHRGEKYKQPKKKWTAFGGGGQRLGAPVPGISTSQASQGPATSSSGPTAPASTSSTSGVEVDESQPTLTLQIRLADGTRLPSRFNRSHTIGDVYAFVDRASQASTERPYSLATTFPTKELSDEEQVLGDMPEFSRGGVLVQKWI